MHQQRRRRPDALRRLGGGSSVGPGPPRSERSRKVGIQEGPALSSGGAITRRRSAHSRHQAPGERTRPTKPPLKLCHPRASRNPVRFHRRADDFASVHHATRHRAAADFCAGRRHHRRSRPRVPPFNETRAGEAQPLLLRFAAGGMLGDVFLHILPTTPAAATPTTTAEGTTTAGTTTAGTTTAGTTTEATTPTRRWGGVGWHLCRGRAAHLVHAEGGRRLRRDHEARHDSDRCGGRRAPETETLAATLLAGTCKEAKLALDALPTSAARASSCTWAPPPTRPGPSTRPA